MKKRGKLIVIDGMSGSGKSTVIKKLQESIPNSILNIEPTKKAFGGVVRALYESRPVSPEMLSKCESIRQKFSDIAVGSLNKYFFQTSVPHILDKIERRVSLSEMDMQILFMIDRVHDLLTNILPALAAGKNVIQDRYMFSTFAYGASGGVGFDELSGLQLKILLGKGSGIDFKDSWVPDLTLLLDVSAEAATKRLEKSGKIIDIFETYERLKKIRDEYLWLAKVEYLSKSTAIIDANLSPEEVFEECNKKISEVLK